MENNNINTTDEEYFYDDEEYFYDEIFSGYADNMPCDTSGFCVGTSCSNYFKCNGNN